MLEDFEHEPLPVHVVCPERKPVMSDKHFVSRVSPVDTAVRVTRAPARKSSRFGVDEQGKRERASRSQPG
jgi:hypothetical protein